MSLEYWYNAIDNNKITTIKTMIKNGFNVTTDNDYAFRRAAYNGNLELMEILFENGANINANKNYALRTCIYHTCTNCIQYLIKCGTDIPTNSLKILENTVCGMDTYLEIAKMLIAAGTELDTGNNNLISNLFRRGDYEYVKYLIDHSMIIYTEKNICDLERVVVDDKRYDMIELLLENGVDATKLMLEMILYDDPNVMELLFTYGADLKRIGFEIFISCYEECYINYKHPKEWLIKMLVEKGLPKRYLEEMLKISRNQEDRKLADYIEKFC